MFVIFGGLFCFVDATFLVYHCYHFPLACEVWRGPDLPTVGTHWCHKKYPKSVGKLQTVPWTQHQRFCPQMLVKFKEPQPDVVRLRFLCIQNFREGRNYKVSRLEADSILGHLSAKEHLLIINLEGEGPLCLVGARFLHFELLLLPWSIIMQSTAFGQYAIFKYGPPVHYRRNTCPQTFKQVSVGFPKIGASPYIIPHFLPIGKYIYKTHGPCYLHRGDHPFFFSNRWPSS